VKRGAFAPLFLVSRRVFSSATRFSPREIGVVKTGVTCGNGRFQFFPHAPRQSPGAVGSAGFLCPPGPPFLEKSNGFRRAGFWPAAVARKPRVFFSVAFSANAQGRPRDVRRWTIRPAARPQLPRNLGTNQGPSFAPPAGVTDGGPPTGGSPRVFGILFPDFSSCRFFQLAFSRASAFRPGGPVWEGGRRLAGSRLVRRPLNEMSFLADADFLVARLDVKIFRDHTGGPVDGDGKPRPFHFSNSEEWPDFLATWSPSFTKDIDHKRPESAPLSKFRKFNIHN